MFGSLRRGLCLLAAALGPLLAPPGASARAPEMAPGAFLVLSYHEVSGDLAPATAQDADRYGVEISHLVAQFNWLRENG